MDKSALIVFVRNPIPGKVKTRLIKDIGITKATAVYEKLLRHTAGICEPLRVQKFVYYADEINHDDLWDTPGILKRRQTGKDLGERMMEAFAELQGQGYEHIVIIGSDCYQLTSQIVTRAFDTLKDKDAVIGPAKDGGYYLLGLSRPFQNVFRNKEWSGPEVADRTIDDLSSSGLSFGVLETLQDVDTADDLEDGLI